jgi:membrane protease YdiL (CAAX protease family)
VDVRVMAILATLSKVSVLILCARGAGLDWRRLFGGAPGRESLPLLTVVAPLILLTFGAVFVVFLPLSYPWPHFVEQHLLAPNRFFEPTTVGQWVALVIGGCVLAPIFEEVFFRGILMHRWARRWGTPTGVVASSVLFALLHDEWIGKFIFGVAMCALYLRTRRLWVSIAAHAINNALFIVPSLSDVLAHRKAEPETLAQFRAQWWIGALSLAAGLVLLRVYVRRLWPNGQMRAVLTGPVPYEAAG